MAPLLFLSIQNRSGRKCSRMANSSALPFPIPSGGEDVVPLDEGIRDCGVWSTTSVPASVHPDLGTWCFRTKKQGFAGDGAPRQCRRRPIRTWGRGASGRRNKGLRGVRHHVHDVEVPLDPRDVVLPDEGIRVCGE